MSIIYIFCCFVTFLGTKEMKGKSIISNKKKKKLNLDVITDHNKDFFKSFKMVFRHKSYITLLLAFLFNSLAVQVKRHFFEYFFNKYIQLVQSNLALFCKYTVDAGDQYQFLIITLLVNIFN